VSSFSVFLPVRNGWPYVKDCVTSVLAQSHADLELHVLDNCSTDDTVAWVRALDDPRIRLTLSPRPLNIQESWARVKTLPKREFMTLIGHDDLFDPGFLAAVDATIRANPDAALYQTGARLINAEGRTIRSCRPVPAREGLADYLAARFRFERDVSGTGFVFRSADYDRVGGIPPFERLFFADDALWLSLLASGYKACDPRELCSIRVHTRSESASLPSAWRSILKGLNQFIEHMQGVAARDPLVAGVAGELLPGFSLEYHRSVLIFALVDASSKGERLDPAALRTIEESLAAGHPEVARDLRAGQRVRVVRFLNATPLRRLTPTLWRLYYAMRTRSF
jgi:glycosyltransferase involved in cell wall biosynthesis